MSTKKIINKAICLVWISYACQCFLLIYFSAFQKNMYYRNIVSVAGFRELFMCLFFVNSCVTKNIVQLKFYLVVKFIVIMLMVPRYLAVINSDNFYLVLGLLFFLFYDISLYFYYYKTLSLMYKKYYFARLGASEDLKGKLNLIRLY